MIMKEYKKWNALALVVGITTLFSSCAVHRHPRPHHRHHLHHHKVVIIAEQTTGTDCITFEECLAMTEPDSYGSTE